MKTNTLTVHASWWN